MGLTRKEDLAGEILVVKLYKKELFTLFLLNQPKRKANTYFSVFRTWAFVTF